jgi:hypothetical protein
MLVLAVACMLQYLRHARLAEANRILSQQLEKVSAENDRLKDLFARTTHAQGVSTNEVSELLRLRGRVSALQTERGDIEKLQQENRRLKLQAAAQHSSPKTNAQSPFSAPVPKDSWTFAGYSTPENALRTLVWAWTSRDTDNVLAALTAQGRKQFEEKAEGTPLHEALAAFQWM